MIRLQRKGKKHQPFYRLVVGEKRSKLNGEQVEELGWFDPLQSTNHVDAERVKHWLSVGAKMSPAVNNLLIGAGVVTGKKVAVHRVPKAAPAEAAEAKA